MCGLAIVPEAVGFEAGAYVVTLVSGGRDCQCRVSQTGAGSKLTVLGRKVCSSSAFNSQAWRCLLSQNVEVLLPSAEASVHRTSRFRICINASANLKCCFETTTVPSDNQTSTNQQPWPRKYCLQTCSAEQHSTTCMSRLASASERPTFDIGDLCARTRYRTWPPWMHLRGRDKAVGMWQWTGITCGRRIQKTEDVQCSAIPLRPLQHKPPLHDGILHRHFRNSHTICRYYHPDKYMIRAGHSCSTPTRITSHSQLQLCKPNIHHSNALSLPLDLHHQT